jgi:hypothetical protein
MNHDELTGDEPLADGMHIVVRLRRDFTVTSASRLLAAARVAYVQVNPGTTADDAATAVTSAADAIFTITLNESSRLPAGARCAEGGGVLAVPAGT